MKKLLIAALLVFSLGCKQTTSSAQLLSDEQQKKAIFSSIANNNQLAAEMMDSLMQHHHDKMMSKMDTVMKNNTNMQMGMMSKMMDMCDKDTAMCKMMAEMVRSHPNLKKEVDKESRMKNMPNPDEHAQHHKL